MCVREREGGGGKERGERRPPLSLSVRHTHTEMSMDMDFGNYTSSFSSSGEFAVTRYSSGLFQRLFCLCKLSILCEQWNLLYLPHTLTLLKCKIEVLDKR